MPISLNIRYTKYVTGHNRYCLSLNKNTQYNLDTLFFNITLPSTLRSRKWFFPLTISDSNLM